MRYVIDAAEEDEPIRASLQLTGNELGLMLNGVKILGIDADGELVRAEVTAGRANAAGLQSVKFDKSGCIYDWSRSSDDDCDYREEVPHDDDV